MSARVYSGKAKCVQGPKNPEEKMTLHGCTALLFVSEWENWEYSPIKIPYSCSRGVCWETGLGAYTLSQQCVCQKNEFSAPVLFLQLYNSSNQPKCSHSFKTDECLKGCTKNTKNTVKRECKKSAKPYCVYHLYYENIHQTKASAY